MMMLRSARATLCSILCASPAIALAHPGHEGSGLMTGVVHPFMGLDHLLMMFMVGLWAAQQRAYAAWILPTAFVGCMLVGGLLGFGGFTFAYLETGIAASVVAFGILVAMAARLPMAVALLTTGLFGFAHGIAHGLELPDMNSAVGYTGGFVAATCALHGAGYALARWMPASGAALIRAIGLVSAAAGTVLLAG